VKGLRYDLVLIVLPSLQDPKKETGKLESSAYLLLYSNNITSMALVENIVVPLGVGLILMSISTYVGYRLGKKQAQETQSEEIQKLKDSILTEVESNEELLNKDYDENKYGHKRFLDRLFRDAFNSATSTDNFISLSTELQTPIKFYYSGIDKWNELVDKLDSEERALTITKIYNAQSDLKNDLLKTTKDLKELLKY
jgi:hypothetical protein